MPTSQPLLLTMAVVLLLLVGVERPHAAASRVTCHVSSRVVTCPHPEPVLTDHLPILILLKNKEISGSKSSSLHWSLQRQGGYWGRVSCSSLGSRLTVTVSLVRLSWTLQIWSQQPGAAPVYSGYTAPYSDT